jgi:membrane fusion protein (multidrug efflux system)
MRRNIHILCLIALIAVAAVLVGCGRGSHSEANGEDETVTVPVEVGVVTTGDIASYFTGSATLEAEDETEVVAKVGGVVERIIVEEGDWVAVGQVLASLDDEKLAVQMEQATANLQKLESEFERSKELFASSLISAQEFQRVKFECDHQKATHDLAKLDLEYTSIRAPISGVVSERLIKVGNMLVANQATFRVTDLDPLLAVLHVPERQMAKLRVGHRARLAVDAIDDEEFAGRIERISPVVDPTTGTVKVSIEVHDASRRLKPGMFARVHIVHDVHASTVLAPRDAIIEEDDKSSVFVVRDSTAYRQTVETGYVNSIHIEVLSGLEDGDTVVTLGKGSLKDSTRVEMVGGEGVEEMLTEAGESEGNAAPDESAAGGEASGDDAAEDESSEADDAAESDAEPDEESASDD